LVINRVRSFEWESVPRRQYRSQRGRGSVQFDQPKLAPTNGRTREARVRGAFSCGLLQATLSSWLGVPSASTEIGLSSACYRTPGVQIGSGHFRSFRRTASSGAFAQWISDESGVFMARRLLAVMARAIRRPRKRPQSRPSTLPISVSALGCLKEESPDRRTEVFVCPSEGRNNARISEHKLYREVFRYRRGI
jgi:hypothetical protein